jgi:hypothetical protein
LRYVVLVGGYMRRTLRVLVAQLAAGEQSPLDEGAAGIVDVRPVVVARA